MNPIVVLDPQDNVATSLTALAAGDEVAVDVGGEQCRVTVSDDVPFGHKIAVRELDQGDDVLKYGQIIGKASRPIAAGEWVHVHNVESARARGDLS